MITQRDPNEQEIKLLEKYRLNPGQWIVVWSDHDVLEVISKRSHRRRRLMKK